MNKDPSRQREHVTHTPDVSCFVPSLSGGSVLFGNEMPNMDGVNPLWDDETSVGGTGLHSQAVSPVSSPQASPLSSLTNDEIHEYSGLTVKRYAIHQGRYGERDDNSLLEAIVQSGFDENKYVTIVAEGSESVHAFVHALSDEFLNCPDAIQLRRVTVVSPEDSHAGYVCMVEGIYPAVPRFRHLAKSYVGVAYSARSVLDASLNAACNLVGHILLTFQPEGYILPHPPRDITTSSIDESPDDVIPEDEALPIQQDSPSRSIFARWFGCGTN